MLEYPIISIIIPCYNHGQFLYDAINSIEQHPIHSIYEIIIINDGSTDQQTLNILQYLEKKGYRIIHQENKGLGAARNSGIKVAKGQYILPLDSDNKIRICYLDKSIKILDQNPNIGVVYGDAQYFGKRQGRWRIPEFDLLTLFRENYIDACAVFRKSIWESINGYDEKMPYMGSEDWDFWMRIALKGWDFHHLKKITFDYRVRKNSMVNTVTKVNQYKIDDYIFSKPEYKNIKLIKNKVARKDYQVNNIWWLLNRITLLISRKLNR